MVAVSASNSPFDLVEGEAIREVMYSAVLTKKMYSAVNDQQIWESSKQHEATHLLKILIKYK